MSNKNVNEARAERVLDSLHDWQGAEGDTEATRIVEGLDAVACAVLAVVHEVRQLAATMDAGHAFPAPQPVTDVFAEAHRKARASSDPMVSNNWLTRSMDELQPTGAAYTPSGTFTGYPVTPGSREDQTITDPHTRALLNLDPLPEAAPAEPEQSMADQIRELAEDLWGADPGLQTPARSFAEDYAVTQDRYLGMARNLLDPEPKEPKK